MLGDRRLPDSELPNNRKAGRLRLFGFRFSVFPAKPISRKQCECVTFFGYHFPTSSYNDDADEIEMRKVKEVKRQAVHLQFF